MRESVFSEGDRVNYIGEDPELIGQSGTIVDLILYEDDEPWIGVEWDTFTNGHDCNGLAHDGHGYYVSESYLEYEFLRDECEFNPASISELFETL